MKTLTSRDNPLFKDLKQLATSSQARRKAGRTLLDGIHLAQAYLQQVGLPVLCVLAQSALALTEVTLLITACERDGRSRCIVLPDSLYAHLSQVEHGIGLLFVIDTPQMTPPERLENAAVLLDNLQDPGNLGSILRSAAAAGIQEAFCSGGTVFAWSPKVLRAGMGAHFALRIHEQADLAKLIAESTLPVIATSSHANQTIHNADLARPVAWLFGNEGQGVSAALLEAATMQLAIPHAGPIESLNVAAAAAVCFFEQLRQVQSRPGNKQL